ncbi:uncharacterized protein LOC121370308 [Gigantopelta aegis]|uniref:uncharacterized protein LOC121370308 n=1 Tax=Gigantopelta aegis TaxID=1735272 RepID=UPI001B8893EF|nr:uncharacterized protein LOC121370308 [Gigantopelta aegis]
MKLALMCVVLVVALPAAFCKNQNRANAKSQACRYKKDKGPCNPDTNKQMVTLVLLSGDPTRCKKANKVIERNCKKACRYRKTKSACDPQTNKQTVTFTLVSGNPAKCKKANKVHQRKCKKVKDCRYKKVKSACNPDTNKLTVSFNLISGDPKKCKKSNKVTERNCKKACRYKKQKSPCDPKTNRQTISLQLVSGDPERCKRTKTVRERKCKKVCRYKKIKSPCNPKTRRRTISLKLVDGAPSACKAVNRVFERKCKKGCKYERSAWSDCDSSTNTRSRELRLKRGKPSKCQSVKTITKPCKRRRSSKGKTCIYQRGPWSECDQSTNTMNRTLTLKHGDQSKCQSMKAIQKTCKQRTKSADGKACKYQRAPWSQCNPVSNTMTRTLTLKSGDETKCQTIKQISRTCKRRAALTAAKECKYTFGPWSKCITSTNTKSRMLSLKKGDPEVCEQTKELKRKCRNQCKYSFGNWTDCDPDTQTRSRTKLLIKGDKSTCKQEISFSKSCTRPNGNERCFFGPWGDFSSCMNGVMMKHRKVIHGSAACERKAVKTRPCS